jgi:hypothetical protein
VGVGDEAQLPEVIDCLGPEGRKIGTIDRATLQAEDAVTPPTPGTPESRAFVERANRTPVTYCDGTPVPGTEMSTEHTAPPPPAAGDAGR